MPSNSHVSSASEASGHVTGKSDPGLRTAGACAWRSVIWRSRGYRTGLEQVPLPTREGGLDVDRRLEGPLHPTCEICEFGEGDTRQHGAGGKIGRTGQAGV